MLSYMTISQSNFKSDSNLKQPQSLMQVTKRDVRQILSASHKAGLATHLIKGIHETIFAEEPYIKSIEE